MLRNFLTLWDRARYEVRNHALLDERTVAPEIFAEVMPRPNTEEAEFALADYEVRHWKGWHHHQILSLLATWLPGDGNPAGKKWTPAITVPQIREGPSAILHGLCGCATPWRITGEREQRLRRNELARLYHWKQHKRLAPLNINKRQI